MAKKKKGKKKATRRTAPKKKKSAAKKTTRKAVSKAKARKPVAPKKAAKARPAPAQQPPSTEPFAVNVLGCDINPPSQNFPPFGNVDFNCSDACELVFSDPAIFGFPRNEQSMQRGNNRHRLIVAKGHSEFSIKGCAAKVGPADIIVP